MASKYISIKGAKENNLKNIDLKIPRDKMVVFTGLSGSGKSSLAFDTIYAEGQRRYVESLSSYARMFLGQMDKPDVDYIDGLSPAISIDQKTTSKNPRSTVGTITEIYDYLRLLYARIGVPHCPKCGREIRPQTVDEIVDGILSMNERTKFILLAPIVRGRKGEHAKELEKARKSGFSRVRVDEITYELSEDIPVEKNKKHNIEIEVDRLVVGEKYRSRIADSIEIATKISGGLLIVDIVDGGQELYSLNYACPEHGGGFEELNPKMFSFNNPFGACKTCAGLGVYKEFVPQLIYDGSKSINGGAIKAMGWNGAGNSIAGMYYNGLAKKYKFSLDTPIDELSEKARNILLYGTGGEKLKLERPTSFGGGIYMTDFEGIVNNLKRRYEETNSDLARAEIEQYMSTRACPDCGGNRLTPQALAVTVGGINIAELTALSVDKLIEFFNELNGGLNERDRIISAQITKEIGSRLSFLKSVGLGYLTLSRSAGTLSGGESQRIRLATQLGTSLIGVLYILDEPSIGLHQKDNEKLIKTLQELRDVGNTLIVVEHDEETMRAADYIVDVGPGAGVLGGKIVAQGSLKDICKCRDSVTGQYLSGVKTIPVPQTRRSGNGKMLSFHGCRQNNLKNIDINLPLGSFICFTGVSGSGKSSFVNEILFKSLMNELNNARRVPGEFDSVSGVEHLDKIINIDQSPIGKSPRSNPATYTDLFTDIRSLFAGTKDAKAKGYGSGRFSFNVKGGRCEACQGDGIKKIEMHFLSDVYVPCEVCGGKRYNAETLSVKYNGKSIYDVLEMTVVEAMNFFRNLPKIHSKLKTIYDVGLGYIKLGQPATTLSGGEAQRVKLSTELSKRSTGRTIYVLDEPTTGLHTADVHRLIDVLQSLVDGGNTVVVIEHNLDVIKTADYIIDLGPDGGDGGGSIVAQGTPEQVAEIEGSYTGEYLKKILS